MTLKEFCKLDILCKDDPIYFVSNDGCYMDIITFNDEITVGNALTRFKQEVLDREISCVTPSGDGAFLIYFKEYKEDKYE
jgi:hypothetical protein